MRIWTAVGLVATGIIVVTLGLAAINEEQRQATAAQRIRDNDIATAMTVYAENCAICHGAAGEGIASNPALDTDALRSMDESAVSKTIARGRYDTVMAAWAIDEGGILSDAQIEQLVTLVYYADWQQVESHVASLGLIPPEPVTIEIDEDTISQIQQMPDGLAIASGIEIYNQECVACHGTDLAPALDTPELRVRLSDADMSRIINEGVPGTLMAGWANVLTPQQVTDVIAFIRNFDLLSEAGIELPTAPAPLEITLTPEVVAEGERLYGILCDQCHGSIGQGTPIAPGLNSQLFLSETPEAAIMQIISGGVPGTVMPAWGGRLTESDLVALTAFIRNWEPDALSVAR